MKVACFSVAIMDYYPQQKQYFPGGNSLNQSVCFGQMGHRSAFVGPIGTDENGDRIAALLKSASVDTSHTHRIEGSTATNQIINDAAGERYGVEGAWLGGVYDNYELAEPDWAFLADFDVWTTHVDGPNFNEALKRKREDQLLTVDFLHLTDYALLENSLRDGVNGTGGDAIVYFGGTADMASDLACIARTNPRAVIVLTLGADGSIAFVGDQSFTQPALPLDRVVDTTGCGDAFQAGFTASYYDTKDIPAALRAGAVLGRIAAQHYGGTASILTG